MSRARKRSDDRQLSLLELLEREQATRNVTGTTDGPRRGALNHSYLVKGMLRDALDRSRRSRIEVAERMSYTLGTSVTQYMIDAWVADSKEGHRFPLDYLEAFIEATEQPEPFRHFGGLHIFQHTEAMRAEIQRDREQVRVAQRRLRRKEALIAAIEGRPL